MFLDVNISCDLTEMVLIRGQNTGTCMSEQTV